MARLKTLFFRSNLNLSTSFFRRFHSTKTNYLPSNWMNMTELQRMEMAVVEPNPNIPELSYYKALGLLDFGPDYYDQAISALKDAIDMKGGNYWMASYRLADIYNQIGQEHNAFVVLMNASINLMNSLVSDRTIKMNKFYDDWLESFKLAEKHCDAGHEHLSFKVLIDAWTKLVKSINTIEIPLKQESAVHLLT